MKASRLLDVDRRSSLHRVSFGLILIAGVVLIGWHAHIPRAVQIFPGLIPMQYNTALCFLALGAAGIGLTTGRRLLAAGGGCFAGLMGTAVVLEYATGRSLGIDTLFFYPWERVLSSEPGRMALSTAASFVLIGLALIVITVRSHGHGIFGLLNAVPVSLALTSLIGYTFGITFVLPFSLGSQMALATCVGLLAYGSAALGYSWARAERGPDGMPQWTAGLGLAFLPTLMVGASAIFPQSSWPMVSIKLLLSVAGTALITAALRRMTTAKVANRGLALAAGPLLLVLALVGLVVHVERTNESAQEWAFHSSEVLLTTQQVRTHVAAAESAAGGYALAGDVALLAAEDRAAALATEASARLRTLVSDNPAQAVKAGAIEQLATEYLARLSELVRSIDGGQSPGLTKALGAAVGSDLARRVQAGIATFSQEEARLAVERRQVAATSGQRLNWLLVSGSSAAILQTVLLALAFRGSIGGRLQQLRQNAVSLAAGQALAPTLTGQDEIAELDRAFHDMSASLETITRREKAIIEGATDSITIKDFDHRYVMINAWSASNLGKTVDEVIGASIFDLFEPETAQRICELDDLIIAGGETATYELAVAPRGGPAKFFSTTFAPYRDQHGAMVGVITMSRDITTQKEQEATIARISAEQLRFKDEFLSHVSHELRSPLSAIKSFSAILRDQHSGPLNSAQQDYVRIILKNVQQQQSMIDDLLEVTRLGTGKLTVTPTRVSVQDAVTDSMDTLQGAALAKQVTISAAVAEQLPWAYADQTRLRQILIILLDNAIKFTPSGGAIEVRARLSPLDSRFVLVEVSDTGSGMSPEVTKRIFERLYQEGATGQADQRGLGLGLYISRALVTQQGGRIWAESRLTQGTTLSFTLPVFSLATAIAPLLTNGQWPGTTLALVMVEACRLTPWPSPARHAEWSQAVRQMLERCLMPDRDVHLPSISSSTSSDTFFVAAFADHKGATVLADRIRHQFERLPRLSEPGLTLSVTHTLVASPPSDQGVTTETMVASMAEHLEGLMTPHRAA